MAEPTDAAVISDDEISGQQGRGGVIGPRSQVRGIQKKCEGVADRGVVVDNMDDRLIRHR
jgi:hypothetical protein